MANSSDIRYALQDTRAFILYRLEPKVDPRGFTKLDKIPTSPFHGGNIDPHDPANWLLASEALFWADMFNAQPYPPGITGYGTGVIISEDIVLPNGRRLFALDIDKCRDGDHWAPHATAFLHKLPGAGVEVSVSGNGLHGYGTYSGERPDHGTRNKTYGLELYTRLRFMACTGAGAVGDCLVDLTRELHTLAAEYFPLRDDSVYGAELSTVPVPEWVGPADDGELLRRAMRSTSAGQVFAGRASFAALWNADEATLSRAFPPQQHGAYDASAADQALANHLAFWTGNHGERMLRLMNQSSLARNKWERAGYLHNTIQRACGSQKQWYKDPRVTIDFSIGSAVALPPDAPPPPAPTPDEEPGAFPSPPAPLDAPIAPLPPYQRPPVGTVLLVADQIQMFEGCTYVQDINQILMPQGHTIGSEKFDAEFAGYTFAMTVDGQRPSKKAWDAFVFSELHKFPKVKGLFFDPNKPSRDIIYRDGNELVNSYIPSIIIRRKGDASPFLDHLRKLLPRENDSAILLAYMAACVQHPGSKFQWWPLIQGVEGNGKSTLSYLLEYAIGERYTHWPKAAELGSKFNSAFYGKLLICCEDVFSVESRGLLWETLKPMITSPRLEIEGKGIDKVTREVCFNGMMNSNHKNALRKTANDRRIGPFFCAQQSVGHLERDGMDKGYFKTLRAWRLGIGKEIVAEYLLHYEIPDEWNPAKDCDRCPKTTATHEAISAGLGAAEQEVIEAIAQGQLGFRGGWVSSMALDRLLASIGKGGSIPRNKRGELLEALGYMTHPGLPEGRATVTDTDGSRPTLYVLATAQGARETDPAMVMSWYQIAQK